MIPDFETIMRPLLELLKDGNTLTIAEIRAALAIQFALTQSELEAKHASGDKVFYNRVRWSVTHFRHAGIITSPQRGIVHITDRGRGLLTTRAESLKAKDLRQFPEYANFVNKSGGNRVGGVVIPGNQEDIVGALSSAHQEIQYLLLALGSDMGMDIWVARNDRGRSFNGHPVGSIQGIKTDLPLQFDEITMRTIELIDVL